MGKEHKEIDYSKYKGKSYTAVIGEMEVGDPCPCCGYYPFSGGKRLQYRVVKVDYTGHSWKCQIKHHGGLELAKFLIKNWDKIAASALPEPSENEFGPVSP